MAGPADSTEASEIVAAEEDDIADPGLPLFFVVVNIDLVQLVWEQTSVVNVITCQDSVNAVVISLMVLKVPVLSEFCCVVFPMTEECAA